MTNSRQDNDLSAGTSPAQPPKLDDWTTRESNAASREGWDIFAASTGIVEIERIDDDAIFADDAEALAHVTAKAATGSKMHQRALAIIATENAA